MKKRILLVDDDPGIIDALVVALEDRYDLGVAYDGEQGLREVTRKNFDAIVLDLMMPLLDGAGLMRELAGRGIDIPVLIVSASNDLKARAAAIGAADSLQKPFDLEQLEQKLESIVGGVPTEEEVAPTSAPAEPAGPAHRRMGSTPARPPRM
jgi:two-component system response regulator MprA